MNAVKCLYQALKADKDLLRLYASIAEVVATKEFKKVIQGSSKLTSDNEYLQNLTLTDSTRTDMANTYLNICSLLSQMGNHEKALHMVQKAIELITQQVHDEEIDVDDLSNKIMAAENRFKYESFDPSTMLVTLTAAYYNKASELEYLSTLNANNRDDVFMASQSIQYAYLLAKKIPDFIDSELLSEIKKKHERLYFNKNSGIRIQSKAGRRQINERVFSPISSDSNKGYIYNLFKNAEMSPKSLKNGGGARMYNTKLDKSHTPLYKKRVQANENKGNKTDLGYSFSPIRSDKEIEGDNDSVKFSDASNPVVADHPYFNLRKGTNFQRHIFMSKPAKQVEKPKSNVKDLPDLSRRQEIVKNTFNRQTNTSKNGNKLEHVGPFENQRGSVPDR